MMRRCLLAVLRTLAPFHIDWDTPLTKEPEPELQTMLGVIGPHPMEDRRR